jgi:hypothetical protein
MPSSFYFMEIQQVSTFLLSISLGYFTAPNYAWERLAVNSVAILGFLALLITTQPFRKGEEFGRNVQYSLLCLAYMVTMTGFFGHLSFVSSNSNKFDGVSGNSSINSTVAYSVSLATTTTVIAWLTLVLMIIILILLFLSFFNVVWRFARQDGQELAATRKLAALHKSQDDQIRKNMDLVISDSIQAPSRKPFLEEISFESRPRSRVVVFRTENIRPKMAFPSLRPDLKRSASRAGHIGHLFMHQQGEESFEGIFPLQPKSFQSPI